MTPFRSKIAENLPEGVAQTCSLPYRRFSICVPPAKAWIIWLVQATQAASPRYSPDPNRDATAARNPCHGKPYSKPIFQPWLLLLTFLLSAPLASLADDSKPVSYYHDVLPLLKRSCTGCHHPGKLKGGLDLTSFDAFQKGGKEGPGFEPGKPEASKVIEEVSGNEPSMP